MIENAFETAIDKKNLWPIISQKVDIDTEKVVGAEALVRWKKDGISLYITGSVYSCL